MQADGRTGKPAWFQRFDFKACSFTKVPDIPAKGVAASLLALKSRKGRQA
jgi:hypothetical protein